MDIERLRGAPQRAIGVHETKKAIERGRAEAVFVARDADRRVTDPVRQAARERGLEIVEVDSMRALGQVCGIAVSAAVAAIVRAGPQRPESPTAGT